MRNPAILIAAAVVCTYEVGAQISHEETPASVVTAFHAALAAGDSAASLALLAPDVVVFESGGAEMGRDEYASHHLPVDMQFAAATTREVTDQAHGIEGELAWVLTRIRTTGEFRGREVRSAGVETILLERTPDGWRIVHIHWSSRNQR